MYARVIGTCALVVAQAGGRVTTLEGAPFTSRGGSVLTANAPLHAAMLEVVRRRCGPHA